MEIVSFAAKLFAVSFFLNFLWEVQHSVLYQTCLRMPLQKCVRLLTKMSLKDAFWIVLFFCTTAYAFGTVDIFNQWQTSAFFLFLCLTFAAFVEITAIRFGRWKYATAMPTVKGIGLSPLLELAVTGSAALFFVQLLSSV